jgi:hypothetical protein
MLARKNLMTFIPVRQTSQVNSLGACVIPRNARLVARIFLTVVVAAMLLGSLVESSARTQDGSAQPSQDRSDRCAPTTTAGPAA